MKIMKNRGESMAEERKEETLSEEKAEETVEKAEDAK